MSEAFKITFNFNRIECDSWIEYERALDGGWNLIGMGRRTEFDAKTGAMISNKVEPIGLRGWAPYEMFGEPRPSWWKRLFGWINGGK